jgi:hypothetical protein
MNPFLQKGPKQAIKALNPLAGNEEAEVVENLTITVRRRSVGWDSLLV